MFGIAYTARMSRSVDAPPADAYGARRTVTLSGETRKPRSHAADRTSKQHDPLIVKGSTCTHNTIFLG